MVHKSTIYQLLRKAGIISLRKDAEMLVREGKISVDEKIIFRLDYQINPKKEKIAIDGKILLSESEPPVAKKIFMLHKPIGYLTTKIKVHGRKNVMELLHEDTRLMNSLFPVGQLDYNTSGLLIITNDGSLAKRLLDPYKKVEKEYLVEISGRLSDEAVKKIKKGMIIQLEEGTYKTLSAEIQIKERTTQKTIFTLTLHEGKKRQIRRMMQTLGYLVVKLHRFRIGKLMLGDLSKGKYREVRKEEI
ncbi:rRNA pseudouridine synthase [Candidatus Woesearchaeota archaeon]|nr:rRNA pseudouridine synthase [Candidatus Woesearchaeota archaeon]